MSQGSAGQRQVNVAFIGVGQFIAGQHLPNAASNPKFRIHTLCDLNSELLAERANCYKPLKTCADYRSVLADPEVDLVVIGTRGDMHASLAVEVAAAGKDILVEKPMTQTAEETAAVVEAVRANQVRIMTGYNRRFAPAMQKAKEIFHSQSDSKPANIYYRMATEVTSHYAFDVEKGNRGHLLIEACHIFDVLPWFLEEEPVEIYAMGGLDTNDHVTIRYSRGSIAAILCIARGGLCYPKESMEVFAGYRTLVLQQFVELQMDNYPDIPHRMFFKMKDDGVPQVPGKVGVDGGLELYMEKMSYLRDHDLYWTTKQSVDKGHRQMLDAYADAILNGQPSPIDEASGARATICALAAMESIRRNQPISLNSSDEFKLA